MFPVPCSTHRDIRAWLMEKSPSSGDIIIIALTQLSLTLVSRVCQLCCNVIRRLINSASITPTWEKGGTRPKCISNCHATSFATSNIATSEQISEIFPCSNIPCPTPLCKRHYHIVYDTIQSKQTHCFTYNSSLRNFRMRVCPNPKLVQQVLGERTGFEETIPDLPTHRGTHQY